MWTLVNRLPRGRFQPHPVLLKDQRRGTRLYIPAYLRHQMGDPVYCNLYRSSNVNYVLIQPAEEAGPATRKLSCGSVRLPTKIWGGILKKVMQGRDMVCIWHQIDRGNLRVDLSHEIKQKKGRHKGGKSRG